MMTQSRTASLSSGTVVQTLNGTWQIAADPDDSGVKQGWYRAVRERTTACPVPGFIQQAEPNLHGVVWYYTTFTSAANPHPAGRTLLRFDAIDNESTVWVNGHDVGGFNNPETPFTLDITAAVKSGAPNLVAVRVYNPVGEARAVRPNRNKTDSLDWVPGWAFNYGGILGNVELLHVPAVYIEDIYAKPDIRTGTITLETTLRNSTDTSLPITLDFEAAPAAQGETRVTLQREHDLAPGTTTLTSKLTVDNPRLWSLDNPFLYRITARVSADSPRAAHTHSVRCGFREFRVIDGYFHLNGKRVFLRSTHTGNHLPIGLLSPPDHEFLRRDLIYAKASGFNMVRFISGVAWPGQLDFCDELGLMVYEESNAGWCLKDSPEMKERYNRSIREMVRRDRNHPSVTIFGMLNETHYGPVFEQAVAALAVVREQDDSRLVLLSSGRWDGQTNIGSVSNPGSRVWEHVWGLEDPKTEPIPPNLAWCDFEKNVAGYAQQAGDCHIYTRTPQAPFATKLIRTLGADTKPMFLSEYGIGSLENAIHETRHFEHVRADPKLKDFELVRKISDRFTADWHRWGFDSVYPFPEDFLLESQRLHARQRTLTFDCLRSNPKFCGYNLTGMLDHAITGEGLWTLWRRWKVGTFDAISDGWAPLRWCLFVEPSHVYAGRPFKLEAVLANEDVLQPGEYLVKLRICGPGGIAWERSTVVKITDNALAVPVFAAEVTLDSPPSEYTLAVNMERGGSPSGGRLKFHVSDAAQLPKLNETVATWGLEARHTEWLARQGVACKPFTPGNPVPQVILVGAHFAKAPDTAEWLALAREIARGRTAVFLAPQALKRGDQSTGWLPLQEKGACIEINNWLYHSESAVKRHTVFAGLERPGIMDWEYYTTLIARHIFQNQPAPDEVYAASFAPGICGQPNVSDGYVSGILLSRYRLGHGHFLLNTFRILETLDANPAADRLLLNLIIEARRLAPARSADVPESLLSTLYT